MDKNFQVKLKFVLLFAVELIVCLTPLGSIPILGSAIVATTAMIPVIITGLVLGLRYGALMGLLTGIISVCVWTFIPPNPATAFIFTPFYDFAGFHGNIGSLVISIVPRLLTGIVPCLVVDMIKKDSKLVPIVASFLGSMTNTLLTCLFIALFFKSQYENIVGNSILSIIGITICMNGLPEAILCMIVCPSVSYVLKKLK